MKYVSSIPAYHHISESEGFKKHQKKMVRLYIYSYVGTTLETRILPKNKTRNFTANYDERHPSQIYIWDTFMGVS